MAATRPLLTRPRHHLLRYLHASLSSGILFAFHFSGHFLGECGLTAYYSFICIRFLKKTRFLTKPNLVGFIAFFWGVFLHEWRLLKVKQIWLIKLAEFMVVRKETSTLEYL